MNLQITHETRYDYEPMVEVAQHVCHLQPLSNASQALISHTVQISPEPDGQTTSYDVYGNTRLFFSLQTSHSQLLVTARSKVATCTREMPQSSLPWEPVREGFRYAAGRPYDAAADFLFASPFIPRHADFAAYARPSFEAGQPLLLAAQHLMQRIHTEFTYESQSTEINTPALSALAQRKGVCQDFAHIMIACLRSLGLPARYVSGYLLTRPQPGEVALTGSDASHAWVSVYVPDFPLGARWCDFDPTNNRMGWGSPGEDYVLLATGRDFGDVSPLRGVIHGGADHVLSVGVTVAPYEPAAGMSQSQTLSPSPSPLQSQSQSQSQSQTQSQF